MARREPPSQVGAQTVASASVDSSEATLGVSSGEASASPVAGAAAPAVGNLEGIRLPTTAAALRRRLGRPDAIRLPSVQSLGLTPPPQEFRWVLQPQQDTLSAQNEAYTRTPNYNSPVTYIEIRANNSGLPRKTLLGFVLNRSTQDEVTRRFGGQLVPGGGAFGPNTLKYHRYGVWTYFFFARGRLIGVGQGLYEADSVG